MYMQDHTGRDIASNISSLSVDTSGLVKDTTVQSTNTILGQIKTVLEGVAAPEAEDVSYDNTSSGLTANNVQAAINELSTEKLDNTIGGGFIGPNFNNLTENKNYWINLTGATNAPITGGYGYLEVIIVATSGLGIIMQRFTRFSATGPEMCQTYVRQFVNNQWYSWIQTY